MRKILSFILLLVFIYAGPAFAQGSQAQVPFSSGQESGSTSPSAENFTGNVSAGNLALVSIYISDATSTVTAVALASGCGSQALTATAGSPKRSATHTTYWFLAQVTTGGCNGYNITFNTNVTYVSVAYEYNGLATSNVLDCEVEASGTGTAMDSGGCATSTANVTLLSAGYIATTATFTATGGFTNRFQSAGGSTSRSGQDLNETSTGTYHSTETASASAEWMEHLLALKSGPPKAATPTFSPVAGTYATSQAVTISTATGGATICYTTDGGTPTASTPGTCDGLTYSSPVTLTSFQLLTAIATKTAFSNSDFGTGMYLIGSATPTLPQLQVDVSMPTQGSSACPTLTTGTNCKRTPASGSASDLQSAINAATCGDTIILAAGSTYTGNFTIPNEGVCSGWIVIQSSAVGSLASGTRVSGSCSAGTPPAITCPVPTGGTLANMATITTNTANSAALTFQTATHNWRLIGLEITETAGLHEFSLIETDNGATIQSNLVHNIIIDRCYIHGTATGDVRHGVSFQVAGGAVIDSDIREMHDRPFATDAQAVGIWTSPGPLLFQNNLLSASAQSLMFGGADPSVPNMVPSNITIVGNHFWKDYTAWFGNGFFIKNLFELKNAQRVLIDGNLFELSWADAQNGTAIVFTVRNQSNGCPWCIVQDVTFTHNIVQHVSEGWVTTPSDTNNPSQTENRILFQNNLFTDVNHVTFGGNGWGGLATSGSGASGGGVIGAPNNNTTFNHNSIFEDFRCLYIGDTTPKIVEFTWTNNICLYSNDGFAGGGKTRGSVTLNAWISPLVWNADLLINGSGVTDGNAWPTGTLWNTVAGTGFTSYSGTYSTSDNYQLAGGSPYLNAGTDGKDIGVWDWTCLNAETAAALAGTFTAATFCGPAPPTNVSAITAGVTLTSGASVR